jgi:hypothetical protein
LKTNEKVMNIFILVAFIFLFAPLVTFADEKPVILSIHKSVCYERSYNNTYLKEHPLQEVKWIRFEHPISHQNTVGPYMHIKIRFKSDTDLYRGYGGCNKNSENKLICGIECDGGQFSLTQQTGGKIVMRQLGYGLRVHSCDGQDNAKDRIIDAKLDQETFLLNSANQNLSRIKNSLDLPLFSYKTCLTLVYSTVFKAAIHFQNQKYKEKC